MNQNKPVQKPVQKAAPVTSPAEETKPAAAATPIESPAANPLASAEDNAVKEPPKEAQDGSLGEGSAAADDQSDASLEKALNNAIDTIDPTLAGASADSMVNLQELAATGQVGQMVAEAVAAASDEQLEEVIDDVPQELRIWIHDLTAYVDAMRPGVPQYDSTAGATRQRRFGLRLINAANTLGAHYNAGMDYLLNLIHENSGTGMTFNADYLFRFMNEPVLRKNAEERDKILNYLSFLTHIANPGVRQAALKQIDMKMVLACLPDDQSRRRLQNYLSGK